MRTFSIVGWHGHFEEMPGTADYRHLLDVLPSDIANWRRAEGDADFTPFVTGAGAVRHLSCVKRNDFYTLAIGIDARGLPLTARRAMTIEMINPLTGEVGRKITLGAGQQWVVPQGPQAQLIRGRFVE
jgi:hypothetical protein